MSKLLRRYVPRFLFGATSDWPLTSFTAPQSEVVSDQCDGASQVLVLSKRDPKPLIAR